MSFKEITQLRKEGKLEEALTFAQEDYNKEPENIWNKRSLSWVYYEFAKKAATEGNINSFLENVQKIKDLQMPSEEKMVFNTLIWEYRISKRPIAYIRVLRECILHFLLRSFLYF